MAKLHVPLDVDFATDAKILSAGHTAAYLYICSLAHCKRTAKPGEDGVIHREQLRVLAYGLPGRPDKLAEILVDVGLWKPHRRGWMIPAWLKHNPSSEQLAADKAMRRAKSIQGNHEQHHVAKDKKALDCVLCYPEGPPSPAGSPLGSPRGPGKDSYKRREGNSKGREGKGREGKGREQRRLIFLDTLVSCDPTTRGGGIHLRRRPQDPRPLPVHAPRNRPATDRQPARMGGDDEGERERHPRQRDPPAAHARHRRRVRSRRDHRPSRGTQDRTRSRATRRVRRATTARPGLR